MWITWFPSLLITSSVAQEVPSRPFLWMLNLIKLSLATSPVTYRWVEHTIHHRYLGRSWRRQLSSDRQGRDPYDSSP